jgi:hypothetical protein
MRGTVLTGQEIDLGEIKLTPRKVWPTIAFICLLAWFASNDKPKAK